MERSHNLADILMRHRDGPWAGRPAVRCGEERWTYGAMAGMAARAGNLFGRLAVGPGDRVVLLLHDGPAFIASFFGAAAVGALPVPLNTLLAPAEYEYLLNHSQARVVVVSAALAGVVSGIRGRCGALRHVVVVGGSGGTDGGTACWEERLGEVPEECPVRPVSPESPGFWLYSSGSSGFPKAVVHAHRSMGVTGERYARETLGLEGSDVCFSAAKLFHAYGLGNGMSFPLHVGAEAVLWPGPPMPETLFEVVARHRPTVFYATPALYNGMLGVAASGGGGRELESVRLCVSAGEALPAGTFRRWQERFGKEILDGIGSTEMLHIFISNRPGLARAGSSGTIVPGYRAKVVDEAGAEVPAGTVGDLWVGGDSATLRYEGDEARTRATVRGEWVVTGDKYVRDAEGYFWFQGRSDDMLKVNGLWVSPAEVEHVLGQHPDVMEAAVIGVRDPDGLTQIKAYVVLRAGIEESPALVRPLQAHVKRHLPQRYPRSFRFLPALPKTATGKIKRYQLRELEAREREGRA